MLKEEIKNIKEDKTTLRKFGLTVGTVLLLVGIVLYLTGKSSSVVFGGVGVLLILFGLILPNILKPLNKIWMTLAVILGWFMSRVILIILFYLIITPIGFLLKIFGRDHLKLKRDDSLSSYWEDREKKVSEQIDYERQF
ncbi:MAG: SxtJ family membrane protein [Ignavibacteria bacterium]|nr:SxtJ family membrane protein [Ignavibacteria bacterium]